MSSHDLTERSYRILLIEDDLVDVELVRRHLSQIRRPRFEVENVQYLQQACDRLVRETFDAVLLDLNLPDSCGLGSVDQLTSAWSDGPIIVLTGVDEECLGVDAMRHGVQDYLAKDGLSANLLSRAVRYSVERHRMAYWMKATGQSKDHFLADVCNGLRDSLAELLLAVSDLVESNESPRPEEIEQVETIMRCGRNLADLIEDASPVSATAAEASRR